MVLNVATPFESGGHSENAIKPIVNNSAEDSIRFRSWVITGTESGRPPKLFTFSNGRGKSRSFS